MLSRLMTYSDFEVPERLKSPEPVNGCFKRASQFCLASMRSFCDWLCAGLFNLGIDSDSGVRIGK